MNTQRGYVNAQEMHRQHPDTFAAPSAGELAAISPGDSVKVCTGDERFWVTVTRVDGGHIVGTVDNDLIFTAEHGLNYGDEIHVGAEHVYDIISSAAAA